VSSDSPFPLRGLKGLWWAPEQHLGWPAFLAAAGYDLFMLCYTFCPETGLRWRQPFQDAELQVIGQLAEECRAHGTTLCLALHPLIGGQAWAPEAAAVRFHPTSGRGWFVRYWQARRPGETLQPDPPIDYGSEADLTLLTEKCQQARALGVDSIALCLDDVEPGASPPGFPSLAAAHLWLANGVHTALASSAPARSGEPTDRPPTRLFVVPTYYWTDGARSNADYTAELASGLPSDVDVFWTGQVVRDHDITAQKAREAAGLFGRKPVVWLNYASNDSFRFMPQLPPDNPPAADLAPETAGLLLNSTRQVGLARLDALVVGAYLADPVGYDHQRSVEQAARALVGEVAAAPLLRVIDAWQAVPDVRTLTHDLQAGGHPLLDSLPARLRPAVTTIEDALPTLTASSEAQQIAEDLAAGAERLRLLADALTILKGELIARGSDSIGPAGAGIVQGRFSPARQGLLARLASTDPELACDAEAVLTLGPA
jgi:hypothetical protein